MKTEIIFKDEDGSHILLLPLWVVKHVLKELANINKLITSTKIK